MRDMSTAHDALDFAASERKQQAIALFKGLPRHYDLIASLFSFGQDPRWRRAMVDAVAASESDVILDVATGTGMVAEALIRRTGCSVVALDQSVDMLARARRRITDDATIAARLEVVWGEAEELPFEDGAFDGLTFTYLLRYVDDPAATVRELARVVKPGGRIASVEFGVPARWLPRQLWRLYTRVGLPILGCLVSRDWYLVGRFLGPNIEGFYARHPLAELQAVWREAGIDFVQARPMSLGGGVVTWGVKRAVSPAD